MTLKITWPVVERNGRLFWRVGFRYVFREDGTTEITEILQPL